MEMAMKKTFLIAAVAGVALATTLGACKSNKSETIEPEVSRQTISSRYTIDGDVVHVNNRKCAMSGSPLAENNLEEFQSRVQYDGPVEEFKGKTLVFNQCCNMCIKNFPGKWATERDAIMQEHGLVPPG